MIVGASAPKIKPIAPTPSSKCLFRIETARPDWPSWQSRSARHQRPDVVRPAVFDFASAYMNGERPPPKLFSQLRAKG